MLGLVVLELGSFALVTTGVLSARVPSYSLAASTAGFWGDLSPEFGVWHPPNIRYRHQKACFSVVYESNSYGARDVERSREADVARVVVLGDSFMEGYGVAREDRLSDVLERDTGVAFLNFGASGNVGPTHAYALYAKFASRFRHDAVVAAILPENDFDDDLPQAGRYQPYWHGSHPDYELRYSLPSVEQSTFRASTDGAEFELSHVLREFTYTQNVGDLLYSAYKQQRTRDKIAGETGKPDSRFFLYSRAELQRLCHSYEELARVAAPRPVVLFTIPRLADFAPYAAAGKSPLDDELAAWASHIPNIHFVPLLPEFQRLHGKDLAALFLACDAHWSPAGHRAAARILLDKAGKYLALR